MKIISLVVLHYDYKLNRIEKEWASQRASEWVSGFGLNAIILLIIFDLK